MTDPTPTERARAARSRIQRLATLLMLAEELADHPDAKAVVDGVKPTLTAAQHAEVAAVEHAAGSMPALGGVDLVAQAERAAELLAGLVALTVPAMLVPRDADGRPDRQALTSCAGPLEDGPFELAGQTAIAAAAALRPPYEALLELAVWPPTGEAGPDPVRRVALALTGRLPTDGLEALKVKSGGVVYEVIPR